MSASLELSLVVPAYNEVRSIGQTLDGIIEYLDRRPSPSEVIVVADGEDGTRDRALERSARYPNITVTGGQARRGKGRAVREGVALARGRMIGYLDADGKTPVEELDKLIPWLEGGYDVVLGSRRAEGARIEVRPSLTRRLGSRAFLAVVHAIVGLRGLRDTQCGLKLFRGDVAKDLFRRQRIDGYMFDVEVLHLAEISGYRIAEVGVHWRDDGDSRLDLASCSRNVVDILCIGLRRG